MKLVPDYKDAWRWFSVQAMSVTAAATVAWANLPPDLKDKVPDDWMAYGAAALTLLGIIGRLVDQK